MSTVPPPRPASYTYNKETTTSYSRATGAAVTDDEKTSFGYGALALAHAALAVPLLFQPRESARFLLGGTALPTNAEHDRLFGLLAAGLLTGATTAWALKGEADEHRLETEDNERLQAGMLAFGAAALSVIAAHSNDLTRNGTAVSAAAAALTFGVPAARALGTARGRNRLGGAVQGFFDHVGRCLNLRSGGKLSTALYGVLTPVFFLAGASYLAAPQKTLGNLLGYVLKGSDSVFLWRQAGGALLTVLPAVTYTLKEKADKNELNDPTARTLNLGLLLASLGHLVVLGPMANEGTGGKYLPALVGAWATALAASAVGLSSSSTARRI